MPDKKHFTDWSGYSYKFRNMCMYKITSEKEFMNFKEGKEQESI